MGMDTMKRTHTRPLQTHDRSGTHTRHRVARRCLVTRPFRRSTGMPFRGSCLVATQKMANVCVKCVPPKAIKTDYQRTKQLYHARLRGEKQSLAPGFCFLATGSGFGHGPRLASERFAFYTPQWILPCILN